MSLEAVLDGKFVDAATISPLQHRFIGTFRPAVDPTRSATCYILCTCRQVLQTMEAGRAHYLAGCFDIGQYETIEGYADEP